MDAGAGVRDSAASPPPVRERWPFPTPTHHSRMDRPYVPISCAVHDQLLALATLRQECALTIGSGEGFTESVHGIIVDVFSRGGAEYLELGDGRRIRLDEIVALDGRPVPPP